MQTSNEEVVVGIEADVEFCLLQEYLFEWIFMPKGKRKPFRTLPWIGSLVMADRKGILRCDGGNGSAKSTREL
jgi:hypothetical protein